MMRIKKLAEIAKQKKRAEDLGFEVKDEEEEGVPFNLREDD